MSMETRDGEMGQFFFSAQLMDVALLFVRDQKIIRSTDAAARFLEAASPEALVGRKVSDLLRINDRPLFGELLADLAIEAPVRLRSVKTHSREMERHYADVEVRRWQVMQGTLDVWRLTATIETAIAQFVHDFRGPVSVIAAYLDLLAAESHDEGVLDSVRTMRRATRQADEMIESLRGRTFSPTNLNTVVQEICLLPLLPPHTGLDLDLWVEQGDIPVLRLRTGEGGRVVRNLFKNALDAVSAAHRDFGQIEITTRVSAGEVQLCMRDNGIGMSQSAQDRIFEESGLSFKQNGDHSGLGVAICRSLLDASGGRLLLTSTPGVGTVFEACWPARLAV